MKSKTEELLQNEHRKYTNFELRQLVIDLDKNDRVTIQINRKTEQEYVALYENSHINLRFQQKGGKK